MHIREAIHILLGYLCYAACYDHPTPKVYDKAEMMGLAVRIRSKILQPFGSGMDLLNDIKRYMKEMEKMLKAIDAGETEAINAYNRINSQGGPVHLMLMPVDTKALMEAYKWDEPTKEMFEEMMEQTLSLWKDMRILVGLARNGGNEPSASGDSSD
jgi:hypothetical protein